MQRYIYLFLFIALNTSLSAFNNRVKVNIYKQQELKTIAISPQEGKYQFTTEKGKVYKLKKNNLIYFTVVGDSVSVWDLDKHLGLYSKIILRGLTKKNSFKIEAAYPEFTARFYEGDLEIQSNKGKLSISNTVHINDYLAGVVEAESGPNAPFEFYKSQAIISRTYLLSILAREGMDYQIGDDVNHQVYHGMCHKNLKIRDAVIQTSGLVITDSTQQLITAAFHSNSGGQTANSEDVWLSQASYLRATPDPFSLQQRNTVWRDSVSTEQWVAYLIKNGISINPEITSQDKLRFEQKERLKYLQYNKDTLSLRKIRNDFKLRSTWFSIIPNGEHVVFIGRGYGHGVGLSQEGAMQMARQNYNFIEIIQFYYKNVKVVNYSPALAN